MSDILENVMTEEEREEIKELISTIILLPKEDRAILLSNANALKTRLEIEPARSRKYGGNVDESKRCHEGASHICKCKI